MRRVLYVVVAIAAAGCPAPVEPVEPVEHAVAPTSAPAAAPVVVPSIPAEHAAVEAPVLGPLFTAVVPDGPLRAVYGVYVDVDDVSPDFVSAAERQRWSAARRAVRDVLSDKEARRQWLSPRFTAAFAKHQKKCRADDGNDPTCDADIVLCAQDYAVPATIEIKKESTSTARVVVHYDEGHDSRELVVDVVKTAAGWKVDGVTCPRP